MKKYNNGDRILVNPFLFGSTYHAHILDKKWGIFGRKYLCKWNYRDLDYGISGERIGFIYWWSIVCKN